jgi:hypothetical protein
MIKIKILLVLFILYFIFLLSQEQLNNGYSKNKLNGEWIKEGDGYYSLVITHIDSNAYNFSISGLQEVYDPFVNSVISYSGEMKGDDFIFYLDSNMGLFNDNGRLFDGEDFYEGLEPCFIVFLFNENYVKLGSENCSGWFGGRPINWSGKYIKE